MLDNKVQQKYRFWLDNVTDKQLSEQLREMTDEQITNAFYKDLEFGTGGMRGEMGAGTNCLNIYTIVKATAGLANYMKSHNMTKAAITYDSRLNSRLFSQTAAGTLASNGITVYITEDCMPTPFLSFLIRSLGCDMGVNVTASHNPKQYNGYKVYDKTGCQVLDEAANEITDFIEQIDPFEQKMQSQKELADNGLIQNVNDKLICDYVNTVLTESLGNANDIKVAYTPLNGAGYKIVPQTLKKIGAELLVVEEQSMPNGNFTTCPYPNPEKIEALKLVIALANEQNADIVVANDPDCDRLGVAVRKQDGFEPLSGNEVGILLCDYILSRRKETKTLPENPVIVTTIVSTPMVKAIAADYNATVCEVLTGFKYIGNVINNLQKKGKENDFVFGFEESCGYLKGVYARDKDGVVASMLVCEMASYYKQKGLTLSDRLEQLYAKYGRYDQRLVSYRFAGADGATRKQQLLAQLRQNPFDTLADSPVTSVRDLLQPSDLPKADVLILHSADGGKLVVRPSGTEPLIKCYLFENGQKEQNNCRLDKMQKQLDDFLK